MEPLDSAYEKFKAISAEIAQYINSVETESDTRLKIIDRILVEVLGWPIAELMTEAGTESGFADYVCRVQDRSRLIVEAKRDGRTLGVQGKAAGATFKLSGPAFNEAAAKEGIKQSISYCGSMNAELACVTNGREWIIFRGNRIGDGLNTQDGLAFIFPNLVEIESNFSKFYALLSYESAGTFAFRPLFQEAEGHPIRSTAFHKSYRANGSAEYLKAEALATDIDKIMASFFQQLIGDDDPELIELCFVETAESIHAESQLARIATDILGKVQSIDTGTGEVLVDLIERVRMTRRHEFVLIVGTKGAGKSTFVARFFRTVLPERTAAECVVVRVDLKSNTGSPEGLVDWLDAEVLRAAETTIFPESPNFDEIEGMFFDEYRRLSKGPWKTVYDTDKLKFKDRFGQLIEEMRRDKPNEYIQGLLRNVVNSRKKLPVIVFDNADHFDIDFQQRVYQYARSIYESAVCLVILPVTDRTSWQLSKHGALQSFEHETLFLPTPPTEQVIRKRIAFIERRIEVGRTRPDDRYFVQRGISLSIEDLTAFTRSLQRIFLGTAEISGWIGNFANHDVRRTLLLTRDFIASPHLQVVDLLKAFVAGSATDVPNWKYAKALVRGHYDIYPVGQNNFIQNVFFLNSDLDTSPLLGVRLLQMLSDIPEREHEGATISIDEVLAYVLGMDVENRAVLLWLDAMLKTGLILNFDPTIDKIAQATQIEISPSGRQHLHWATGNHDYLSAMAEVTPLLSRETYQEMRDQARWNWRPRTAIFIEYLLAEDQYYCKPSNHDAYTSQVKLPTMLGIVAKRMRDFGSSAKL